ncbi:hypothetical protein CsSME_00043786 [Camellia sinensis var. sinensis]
MFREEIFHDDLPNVTQGNETAFEPVITERLMELLKMGAYGLVQINMELLPHAHSIFSHWLMIIGTMKIIYAASTSPGQ